MAKEAKHSPAPATTTENDLLDKVIERTDQSISSGELALIRIEHELICSQAQARPRNHLSICNDIKAQLEAYPSFAREAIYNKPVGSGKFARGLSIRAAEAVAEAYGYNSISCEVIPLDADTVKVVAQFTDYQKGRFWRDGGIVSKWYKSKSGKMEKIADDRFYGVTVKAEASRRIREVILRSVPPGLRSELEELAERKIDELLDDSTVAKMITTFGQLGVTQEMLEKRVGRLLSSGWTKEDRRLLLGLHTAIKDGETTVAEAFAEEKADPPQQKRNVTAADLTGTEQTGPKEPPPGGDTKTQPAGGGMDAAAAENPDAEPPETQGDPLADLVDVLRRCKNNTDIADAMNIYFAGKLTAEQKKRVEESAEHRRGELKKAKPASQKTLNT